MFGGIGGKAEDTGSLMTRVSLFCSVWVQRREHKRSSNVGGKRLNKYYVGNKSWR